MTMLPPVPWFSGETSAWLSAGVILFWAGWQWLTIRGRQLSPLQRELDASHHLLRQLPDEPLDFAAHYPELDSHFVGTALLARPWELFRATLIFPQGEGPVIGCRRADVYFNFSSLVETRMDLRFHRAMPGYLIAAGLLFTFLGLMISLQTAGMGVIAADLGAAQRSMRGFLQDAAWQLLPAMSGLFTGVWFSWQEKRLLHEVERSIEKLNRLLDQRIATVLEEQLTYSHLLEVKNQSRNLKSLANQMERPVTVMDEEGGRVQISSHPPIETVLRMERPGGGDNGAQVMATMMEGFLRQWRTQSGEDSEQMRQNVERFLAAMRNGTAAIDQHVGRLFGTLNGQLGELQQACQQSTQELRSLNRPFAEVAELLKETLVNVNRVHNSLDRIAGEFPSTTQTMIDSNQRVTEMLEDQQQRLMAMEGVVTLLTEIRTDVAAFPDLVEEFIEKKATLAAMGYGRHVEQEPGPEEALAPENGPDHEPEKGDQPAEEQP